MIARSAGWVRAGLGLVLGVIARAWLCSLRLEIHGQGPATDRPWVLAFFHGTQFPLLGWRRRRRTAVLVSLSRDGDMQARALPRLGLEVHRGSTTRGGARGLLRVVRAMRRGLDAAFAVDGPKGPYGVVQAGAILAARRAGGLLVPMGAHARTAVVIRRSWDRFSLPLPFSRVVVVLGAPIDPDSGDAREALERAIVASNRRAEEVLDAPPVLAEPA